MCMVFQKDRISKWESHIEKWEHELVDYLCKIENEKDGISDKIQKIP